MAAEQPTRRGTNWAEARDFWLALDPPRSFGVVAKQFGISDTRVRVVARRDDWAAAAAEIDRRTLEQAKTRIVRSRAERVQKTLGIVDALLDRYDAELDKLELRPGELDRIVKLAELLVGEATDRMEFSEVQDALGATVKLALEYIGREQRDEFLDRWRRLFGGDDQAGAA